MENFIFISANYPESYWMFCRGLKEMGARVLAVIDTDYDSLHPQLKANIDECYKVSSFHNYDEVYRAVAYFAFKYGKPDWIESNNEAWLDLDARLRDDFHITSGFTSSQVREFQSKACMKSYYERAGLPVAPYLLVNSLAEAKGFAWQHGWNLVLKPDVGVGASYTWHIHNEAEMEQYWAEAEQLNMQMILEEFVDGNVTTLDGMADENGKIRFLCGMDYVSNCMDSVQNHDSIGTFYNFEISPERQQIAQNVINSFGIRNRFFHGEYFELNQDQEGLGRKGDLVALEMNFRPPGGFCPELINYSYDEDIYRLWAQVLLKQTCPVHEKAKYSAGFVGRRTGVDYQNSLEKLMEKYADELLGVEVLPPAFASAMGDVTIKARFKNEQRRKEFFEDSFARKNDPEKA
ncbi:MAG: acetyl-CoA carboxylase biotin carboxylase subunit family protein [Allobaculum sp.]